MTSCTQCTQCTSMTDNAKMVLLWLRTVSATMAVVISPNYWIVLVMVGLVRLQTDLDPA